VSIKIFTADSLKFEKRILSDILKRFTSAQPSVCHSTMKIKQKTQPSEYWVALNLCLTRTKTTHSTSRSCLPVQNKIQFLGKLQIYQWNLIHPCS